MVEYISKDRMLEHLNDEMKQPPVDCDPRTIKVMEFFIRYVKEFPAADVQPVNRWISVKDRLPDDCVEVLVHDTDCGTVIGWYDKKDGIFVAEFMNELDAVTHWMPLPEPPKEGDTK